MSKTCKSCGREIRVMIFKGTDWCSEDCRKILLGKIKCSYMREIHSGGHVDICVIHGYTSKYGPERGSHRPCLAVEPY